MKPRKNPRFNKPLRKHEKPRHRKAIMKWALRGQRTESEQTHKCISHYDSAGTLKYNQTIPLPIK